MNGRRRLLLVLLSLVMGWCSRPRRQLDAYVRVPASRDPVFKGRFSMRKH